MRPLPLSLADSVVDRTWPVATAGAAEWVVDAVRPYRVGTVGAVLPAAMFETTLRILHPFLSADNTLVPWRVVAGTVRVNLDHTTESETLLPGDGSEEPQAPMAGILPGMVAVHLLAALAESAERIDDCFFGIWDGWGQIQQPFPETARFSFGHRDWLLFEGSRPAVICGVEVIPTVFVKPSLWWPADRGWIVATEIDHRCSYVSCSADAAQRILGNPLLESQVTHADSIAPG